VNVSPLPVMTYGRAVTINCTLNDSEIPFPPDTVIAASYVPSVRPVLRRTLNALMPSVTMLFIEADDSVKAFAPAPDSETVSGPVAWSPMLVM